MQMGLLVSEPGDAGSYKRAKLETVAAQPSASVKPEQEVAVDLEATGAQSASERDQTRHASTSQATQEKTGAYTQREEYLIRSEADGDIKFVYVENNGEPEDMVRLVGLKNIYSKQLPNMPKEYIARLLLNFCHRSVALQKRNGTVVGGITYRSFPSQGFGEIAFCAITSSEQVKGYGTRLMNYTKEFAVTKDKLTHFLTYADNNAVGYFTKQGFTKEITLPKPQWQGYIKDYDGGTLMECVLHPKLRPTQFPALIRAQRAALDAQLRTISRSHVVHPGMQQFKLAGAPGMVTLDVACIPGVKEAGWSPELYPNTPTFQLLLPEGPAPATRDALHRFMAMALQAVQEQEEAWPFLQPVLPQDVPDYRDVIKDPVDLSLISSRLQQGSYYYSLDIFLADFKHMFTNCRTYNQPDTIYYKLATKLKAYLNSWVNARLLHHQ